MTRFIFNVDDVGLSEGHTQAVAQLLDRGVIDRVSLLANGPAFAGAAAFLRGQPQVSAGVHLTLGMGAPVAPVAEVRELVDRSGSFPDRLPSPVSVWLARPRALAAVRREWRAQIGRVRDAGLTPSHLDSHRHVHAWPPLCDLAIELAGEAGVPYVRAPLPALSATALARRAPAMLALYPFGARALRRIRAAGLDCADHLLGFDPSGAMTSARLAAELRAAPPGRVEVMVHAAVLSADLLALAARWSWLCDYRFAEELDALCDPDVAAAAARTRARAPASTPGTPTRIICLHHRLAGLTSHHFNEAHALTKEFGRRGREFVLLVNRHAPAPIVRELKACAVLEDPTFRMEWSFEERSRRFVKMLHDEVDRRLNGDACMLSTISTQLEAHALIRWLPELPRWAKPWVVVLFLSDRWNRSGRDEYERQIAELGKLRVAIAGLTPADRVRVIFLAVTELLAEELSGLLGTRVGLSPLPLSYGDPRPYPPADAESKVPCVVILGGTRTDKGSYLIPDIVRACRQRVNVRFTVHLANDSLTPEALEKVAVVADLPGVTVIRNPMTLPEYDAALASADIALFPYEVIPYRKRSSGVFAEAVSIGKPVVATAGTWMAEQIEAGRAAGTTFEDLQPDSIARAIARCVADLGPLRRSALALGPEWKRRDGHRAFIDLVDAQIALRAQDAHGR